MATENTETPGSAEASALATQFRVSADALDEGVRNGTADKALGDARAALSKRLVTPADTGASLRKKLEGAAFTLDSANFTEAPRARDWILMRPATSDDRTGGGKLAVREGTSDPVVGVFPAGKVGFLAAAGGAGKTAALVRLALAVATGRDWFDGQWYPPVAGRVLLALGEEDAEEISRRVYYTADQMKLTSHERAVAIKSILALPLAGIPLPFIQQGPDRNPVEAEGLGVVRDILDKHAGDGWRLLIFDPLSRFASSDAEKDNAQATRLVQAFETLAEVKGGPGVIIAHHTSQGSRSNESDASTNAVRGVTALTDGARWVTQLSPKTNRAPSPKPEGWKPTWTRTEFALLKSNYGPPAEPFYLVNERGVLCAENEDQRAAREATRDGAPSGQASTSPPGSTHPKVGRRL